MFFGRHRLAIGLLLLIAFKLWLVHTEEIYGSATEYDALWFVNAAKHWYWGSEYSWTAFARPPAYPLFIAFVHLGFIPLRIGIELMQMAGYLTVVAGLRKAGVPRSVCLMSFAAMILHPGSFQGNSVTMADNFYAAILPLALGGFLLTLFSAKLTHATWTGIALAALWNTREESFLILPMIVVFLFVALFRQRLVTRSWKGAARYWRKPAGAMLGTLMLLNLAIDAANYRAFHSFSKSELTASSFRAAYKALLRIKPVHDQRFISVSTDALQKAYSVSPTFAQLKPQFEGELGHNWQVPTFEALGIHEIGGPWFLWALRSTASKQDIHKSAASANRFYRNVAKEINRACDEGRVPSRFVLSSLLDPGAMSHIRDMPQSFPRIAVLFRLRYHTFEARDDDILSESQRALYDEMTYRSPAPGRIGSLGISATLENFIGSYHRFLVVGLSWAGLAAALAIAWHFRWLQASDPLNATLILLGATIFLRVLLFTFLDATWWVGGYDRYLFPVLPLYSCFLILLIYQSIALWRRARQAI
ncbi:MAG: hypothetical protein QOC70_767 [Verrucomicrobiota bacterium]|jgi:hypothetical protein